MGFELLVMSYPLEIFNIVIIQIQVGYSRLLARWCTLATRPYS